MKLQYLLASLKGDAARLFNHVKLVEGNYNSTWQALLDRFDDAKMLKRDYFKALVDLQPMAAATAEELTRIVNESKRLVLGMDRLQEPVSSWDTPLSVCPFEAFCEQNSFGGGWLVIQYRFDGSLDFYRNWTEYRNGFGSPYQEYWLGLERLNQLKSQGRYELLVELKGFNGTYSFAQYDEFEIGSESEKYSLKKLGAFSGTAEDALSRQKGRNFSTKDRDNDIASEDCAAIRHGGMTIVLTQI
ncbi:ficolin-3-like [Anopheles ziemanni]|uniref:ficolin-3-like n=1 Tax=Anopheles coustani TaxID=139045 RepID=UPI002659DE26|nr:ficolin-3-like [Anopheles coustani]XP_058170051.1 ficolin-3-like [Anopheles ziemanni]